MAGHKHITESEARRIWHLHKKGLKNADIALAIERSKNCVGHVVEAFTLASNNEWDVLESKYGKENKKLLQTAKEHFGIAPQAANPEAKAQPAQDNTVKYLAEVLAELRRNNALLEKLVAAWEGK